LFNNNVTDFFRVFMDPPGKVYLPQHNCWTYKVQKMFGGEGGGAIVLFVFV
jgi:hypothetical protein